MTHPQEGGEEPSIKKGAGEVELGFAASIAPRDTPSPPKETPSQEEISKETPSLVFDHGFRAWSQVFVTFLLVVNGFGYLSSFGLFQTYWMNKLDRSASSISWIGSIQMFLLFFIGTLSGRAMDAGYFRSLIWVGCAMQILGTFTTANCGQYWQLVLSQGIVQGLGNGLLFTPAVTLVSTYFSKKRAFALGISACGAPFGGIVFPLIARQLTGKIGFPWTTRVMGFVQLFNTVLILLLARPRPSNRTKGPLVELAAFHELPYTLFSIGIFFALLGLYFAYYYVTVFGKQVIGLSPSDSLTFLIVFSACGIPGRLIPALLSDKFFGPFNTLIPLVAGVGIMIFGWIGVTDTATFYAFSITYGFCANGVQTLFPATISSLVTDITKMGTWVGMVFSIISLACLAGPPIAGALIDINGGKFLYAQLFGGSTIMLGTGILVLARLVQIKQLRQIISE